MTALNPAQTAAVRHTETPLLVLAGAGSGKTRVITEKIAHLIQGKGLSARHIAAVTFTNKAAREMQARVRQLLAGQNTRGLTLSTFHTLGLKILRREAAAVGLRPGFTLYDARDAQALILDLMKRDAAADRDFAQRVQGRISLWKNAFLTPAQALATAQDDFERAAAASFERYEQQIRAYNAVDLDDLIGLPVRLFESNPAVREHWQHNIRYLLVDEYQDTNTTQYRLVKILAGRRGMLTVVGDDDQSIYAWRGAQPENLTLLREDFPNLTVVKLEQNYRSTGRILKAANALIANNPHVFEKRLWSTLGPGEPLRVLSCRDDQHEAQWVVADLVHHRLTRRAKPGDYAILFRGNHQARLLEKALREQDVPYVISGGQSFFDRTEIKHVLAYLKIMVNPEDSGAFLRIANVPRREVGASTLETLTRYAGERGVNMLDAAEELGLEAALTQRALRHLRAFVELIRRYAVAAQSDPPVAVIERLLGELDYDDWLRAQYDGPQADRRIANVRELVQWLGAMTHREPTADLADLVAKLTLIDRLDREDHNEAGDRVSLMTLHAAKGLEFPYVYLLGVEEGLLPHHSALDNGDISEERRLAYVGITRAQRELCLSLARKRRRYGETVDCEPSRFIAELPSDDLEWEGVSQGNPDKRRARGQAHLANLKDLLG